MTVLAAIAHLIRCGSCRETHTTAAEVRDCHQHAAAFAAGREIFPLGCGWEIRVRREITPEMEDAGWYPDSEADLWEYRECGAAVQVDGESWYCTNGHHHHAYGSPAWQAEDQMEWAAERHAAMTGEDPYGPDFHGATGYPW